MRKEKKPFYKKWWVWVIAVLAIGGIINGAIDPYDEDEHQVEAENKKVEEKTEVESDKKETEKEPKKESNTDEEKKIEINKEMELENIKISLENAYVKDSKLSFGFWWSHWATNDKAHFSVFAYPVVTQDGEELEQEDNKDSLLKQTEKGVDSRVDLEYELIDDSPVEIKFKTTSEDPKEETIEVDITD